MLQKHNKHPKLAKTRTQTSKAVECAENSTPRRTSYGSASESKYNKIIIPRQIIAKLHELGSNTCKQAHRHTYVGIDTVSSATLPKVRRNTKKDTVCRKNSLVRSSNTNRVVHVIVLAPTKVSALPGSGERGEVAVLASDKCNFMTKTVEKQKNRDKTDHKEHNKLHTRWNYAWKKNS